MTNSFNQCPRVQDLKRLAAIAGWGAFGHLYLEGGYHLVMYRSYSGNKTVVVQPTKRSYALLRAGLWP
jgi:hypothetical protein